MRKTDFIEPDWTSKNAFGVLGRRKKLCGDDTGNNKRETYKFCIVKHKRLSPSLGLAAAHIKIPNH